MTGGRQFAEPAHTCDVPRCDGTRLGHDLAVDFPGETQQVDEGLRRLLTAIFAEPCSGLGDCTAAVHEHGCYADVDGSNCTDPEDHDA